MNTCPKCNRATLIEAIDDGSGFKFRVCTSCAYYESDSEAYREAPYLFENLGYRILAEMRKKAKKFGLSNTEVQGWIENASDGSYQPNESDDKLPEYAGRFCQVLVGFFVL